MKKYRIAIEETLRKVVDVYKRQIQDYLFDNEDTVLSLEDGTELLDDFDLWKERSDLELEEIMDRRCV